jgi:hypothetical protein
MLHGYNQEKLQKVVILLNKSSYSVDKIKGTNKVVFLLIKLRFTGITKGKDYVVFLLNKSMFHAYNKGEQLNWSCY